MKFEFSGLEILEAEQIKEDTKVVFGDWKKGDTYKTFKECCNDNFFDMMYLTKDFKEPFIQKVQAGDWRVKVKDYKYDCIIIPKVVFEAFFREVKE